MSRLPAEHRRLFAADPGGQLPATDAAVRALVLALHSPADWAELAPLWRGVQADFGWPEAAIAVNGTDAFELWFSLAEPLPRADALDLLAHLQRRYLAGVRADRLRTWPAADATAAAPQCAPFATGPDRWAAYVTPDLPAVFGDDPALDFEPGADAQADLLARLRPVSAAQLRRVRADWAPKPAAPTPVPAAMPADMGPAVSGATASAAAAASVEGTDDPRAFLLSVMNDTTAPLALRIEAAKALLPGAAASR
jgi:hypothetical protein